MRYYPEKCHRRHTDHYYALAQHGWHIKSVHDLENINKNMPLTDGLILQGRCYNR